MKILNIPRHYGYDEQYIKIKDKKYKIFAIIEVNQSY